MVSKSPDYYLNGAVVLVDKPFGFTSFEIVKRIRGILKKKYALDKIKVGHAGTLDPLASGLLVICTGKATKEIDQYLNDSKVYIGEGKFGYTTPSYDLETDETPTDAPLPDSLSVVREFAKGFLGTVLQSPPLYSAIKIGGKRAYELARTGIQKRLEPRKIEIFKFDIINYKPPYFTFEVYCSKGTYIRSLVHDLGQNLGCGAYLSKLKRVKSGNFSLSDAISYDQLESLL
ncbi:MAG: tRNA pseudouridine(55) synthase TruB [Thermaurantimonas sp.]